MVRGPGVYYATRGAPLKTRQEHTGVLARPLLAFKRELQLAIGRRRKPVCIKPLQIDPVEWVPPAASETR
jgi:hypothetical protein